jgi:hypothetical protein
MTPSASKEDDGKSRKWQSLVKPLHLFPKSDLVKRTGSSYLALFRPLQDLQSRFILASAIVLAIAAGAPLPIIGVIFSKIIDSFPPTEDEVRKRVYQLLAVGMLIHEYVTCIDCYTNRYSNCIFCCYVGVGFLLGHCWRTNI